MVYKMHICKERKKTDKHKNTASALNESPKVDVSLLLQLH